MDEEYVALMSNDTWDLVLCPHGANVVTFKWIFKHKFKADVTLERYKARWILRGFTQCPSINYDVTFSPRGGWNCDMSNPCCCAICYTCCNAINYF
jgi:hypothetical protein